MTMIMIMIMIVIVIMIMIMIMILIMILIMIMINTVYIYTVLSFFERFFQRILTEPLQIRFFLFYHKLAKRVMVAPRSVDLVGSSVDPWMCTKFMVNLRMMIPKMVVLPISTWI